MRDLFVALVVFGLLPMTLRRPQVGIYLWSWIGYHNPHRLSFGWALNFPWAMIIALTTFVSLLFSKADIDQHPGFPAGVMKAMRQKLVTSRPVHALTLDPAWHQDSAEVDR